MKDILVFLVNTITKNIIELTNIYRFLSQVENYAISISEKATDDDALTLDEYNTISSLYEYSSFK